MSHPKLKIYLADLTHETVVLVSDTIPINIGYVAAYAHKIHAGQIETKLFKYPQSLIDAIKSDPPDVLALSNYSWNSRLSEHMAGIAKKANPKVVTVMGGTNFPHSADLQLAFMVRYPNTDGFVELEGEVAFSNLIGRVLACRGREDKIFDAPIDGCVSIRPETRGSNAPVLVKGHAPARIRELDEVPSPYLTGLLDHFFDGRLTPFLETNRGCPFTCTFCHTGNLYFNKINMFSIERILAEIDYIGPYMQKFGIKNLHIADTNFGMFLRDKEICESLLAAQKKYSWPLQIMSTTGKNKKEQIIEITKILGNTFSVNMSVQSMDEQVLKNIKRDNIKLDHYVTINKTLSDSGRTTKGELIIGLPGETKESFAQGVRKILDAGVTSLGTYTLMMLHGTPFQDPAYRKQYEMVGKFRVVPLDFGNYDGTRIFDYEEVVIANKDMSFDDYLWMRGLAMMVEVLHNSRPFYEFFRYASIYDFKSFEFIMLVYGRIRQAPKSVQDIFDGFIHETKNELWDNAEDMIAFYTQDKTYEALSRGELGGNVIYKYKAMSLAFAPEGWVDFLYDTCIDIVRRKLGAQELMKAEEQLAVLRQFVKYKLCGALNHEGDTTDKTLECNVDIVEWLKSPLGTPLTDFLVEEPIRYDFKYTPDQMAVRRDQFARYGTHVNAISKFITRCSNVDSLFRKITTSKNVGVESNKSEDYDDFIRYTLSH